MTMMEEQNDSSKKEPSTEKRIARAPAVTEPSTNSGKDPLVRLVDGERIRKGD